MDEIKDEHTHEHAHKKNMKKIRENPWIISTFVLAVLVIVVLVFGGSSTGKAVSEKEASDSLISFLNEQTGGGVAYVSSESDGLLYKITVSYNSQNIPVYVTKDGKYYVQGVSELIQSTEDNTDTTTQEILKADKPVVDLFVMAYCPYGTQAEKGILPVVNLLGDKIDFNLRFVYYAMHPTSGEVEENLRQYCIQKEQKDKFNDYLECFLGEGDSEACLSGAGIDIAKLNGCYSATDKEYEILKNKNDQSLWLSGKYPLFNIDKTLNEQYDVGGSPTLVINGVQVSSGRSPAAYLDTICQSFTDGNVPEECSTSLPSEGYSAGFGWTTASGTATNGAQCG